MVINTENQRFTLSEYIKYFNGIRVRDGLKDTIFDKVLNIIDNIKKLINPRKYEYLRRKRIDEYLHME